ncbi:O-antigen ligase [Ahrensia sp. R2A130]|uniref:O-antigen ligase family protein n=1 Tax=Ahrensia sp. R2A130 TaxID=744979 RepID=UPI0018DC86F1|nr:O-antigen ligase family protein [Ahrensia sp. R2A130]
MFVIFPAIQIMATRGASAAVGAAFVCIVLMHIVTKGRSSWHGEWQAMDARPVIISLGMVLIWWTISLLWSPDPSFALRDGAGVILMLLAIVFLPLQIARTTIASPSFMVLFGIAICAAFMILEMLSFTQLHDHFDVSAELWDLNRTGLFLTLMLPAVALAARHGTFWAFVAVLVAVLSLAAISLSQGQAAQLALFVGVLVALVALLLPMTGRVVAVVCIVMTIAMPFAVKGLDNARVSKALSSLPSANAVHRIALWVGYESIIRERPFIGWGAGAARYVGMTGRATEVASQRGYPRVATSPHSAALEIWTELGLIGAVLTSVFLWCLGAAIDRNRGELRVALTFIFAASVTYSSVSSSLFQGWWLSSLGMALVACFMLEARRKTVR